MIPRLERRGKVTQLIVDGQPFLIRGGEVGNSAASHLSAIESVLARAVALHLNTVLLPVYWDRIEPREGEFDFDLVQSAVELARAHHLRVVFLWFGTWKNGMSCYAPAWVKRDPERFFRARTREGRALEVISPSCREAMAADSRAFAALMRWTRDNDSDTGTVLMVQVENEIGMMPEARDFCAQAQTAFDPAEGEESFTARQFAEYVEAVASAGKREYPLPMFVNASLIRPGYQAGQYASGGPLPHLMEIWRKAAPSVDMLTPDIYFPNFIEWASKYAVGDNPVFIPEMAPSARAAGNGLYAVAQLGAMGACPFAFENIRDARAADIRAVNQGLDEFSNLILDAQRDGRMVGLSPEFSFDWELKDSATFHVLGDIRFVATFDQGLAFAAPDLSTLPTLGSGRWEAPEGAPLGAAMVIQSDEEEFLIFGRGVVLTFEAVEGEETIGIESVQEGRFTGGQWIGGRWLNGDETHQGRHVRLSNEAWSFQRVRLYRYQ